MDYQFCNLSGIYLGLVEVRGHILVGLLVILPRHVIWSSLILTYYVDIATILHILLCRHASVDVGHSPTHVELDCHFLTWDLYPMKGLYPWELFHNVVRDNPWISELVGWHEIGFHNGTKVKGLTLHQNVGIFCLCFIISGYHGRDLNIIRWSETQSETLVFTYHSCAAHLYLHGPHTKGIRLRVKLCAIQHIHVQSLQVLYGVGSLRNSEYWPRIDYTLRPYLTVNMTPEPRGGQIVLRDARGVASAGVCLRFIVPLIFLVFVSVQGVMFTVR